MLKHSLTLRISFFFSLAIIIVLTGIAFLINNAIEDHFVEQDKLVLEDKISTLKELYNETAEDNLFSIIDSMQRHAGLVILIKNEMQTLYSSEGVNFVQSNLGLKINIQNKQATTWEDGGNHYLSVNFILEKSGEFNRMLIGTLAININHHQQFLGVFNNILIKFTIFAGVVSALLGWLITRQGLLPLIRLSEQASIISMKDLSRRMPTKQLPIEIQSLSYTLNNMLERLEVAIERLSNFSSDIAHELRSPVNNLMTQTQVCLSKNRTSKEYVDILASNSEEYERLSRMITDMLFLAKSDNHHLMLTKKELKIEQEVQDLFDFYEALAEDKNITLVISGSAKIIADQLMLRRAFSNILSNAIRHSYENSKIHVSIFDLPNSISIDFENQGNTIDKKDLIHLFERFYRVDKSRTHGKHEGVGLGLAITRSIIDAHNATLSVCSENKLTTFSIKFIKDKLILK
ncbi:heavy metal sensor histidine kinase [Psychromonas sp. SP041]|uniref:heavy metal sensor histidine kinase n=1 Tax=Psychromonas sp. SP041 TaxID=1365007 RepID=UPI0010C7D495|nr:heavy metal sensor histidine kinase [Psychromonas sp. SP041]